MLSRGEDPLPRLKEAIAAADLGLRLDPGHIVLRNIRYSALLFWIDAARLRGTYDRADMAPYLQEARAMVEAHPEEAYFQSNLGGLAQAAARAEVASGGDPTADAEEAIRAYEAGLKTQPRHAGIHRGILLARAAQAKALARDARDPKVMVDLARAAFLRARDAQVPLATLAPILMDALVSGATFVSAQGQDPDGYLEEAGRLQAHLDPVPEDPVELGAIRLRYVALMLRMGDRLHLQGLREKGEVLARSLVRIKPTDPEFWRALAQFHEACGDPAAASQARARALNRR